MYNYNRMHTFLTKCGSARKGLAMLTMSAAPDAMMPSAVSGVLIRFVVHSGMLTWPV